MTMHIILLTAKRDGLVWVTERSAFLGAGHANFATVGKIAHFKDEKVAFSGWGDRIVLEALGHFGDRIKDGSIPLSDGDEERIKQSLRSFANDVLPFEQRQQMERPDSRGLIVATLGESPQVFRVSIVRQPVCFAIYDQLNATAGDVENPAGLFVRYYYPRCNKTIEELLRLGLHTMRLAKELNSGGIGEADAWVCEHGEFRQLTPSELARYEGLSRKLDSAIFDFLLQLA